MGWLGFISEMIFWGWDGWADFDPLKQFAPVIHGNRKPQGRITMGNPPPKKLNTSKSQAVYNGHINLFHDGF